MEIGLKRAFLVLKYSQYTHKLATNILIPILDIVKENMLGKRIKEFRKKKGFSQQKLAEKSGLSFNTITRMEQGIGDSPTLKTLIKLADVLEVGLDELAGRK